MMITWQVFLDPYMKGFLFVNFLGRYGVCGPNRESEWQIFAFQVVSKVKTSNCSNFWPVRALCGVLNSVLECSGTRNTNCLNTVLFELVTNMKLKIDKHQRVVQASKQTAMSCTSLQFAFVC